MFKRILLPIDLSDKHDLALEYAANLAGPHGGEVVLIHIVEVIAGIAMEEERPFYQRLEKTAQAHLTKLGDRLKRSNVAWRAKVFIGQRVPEIIRHAQEMKADLIVLTSPPVDPKNLLAGMGSMSYKVGLFAPCPVLMVK
jgi:nucleotide-binding universal stress UspA family protein